MNDPTCTHLTLSARLKSDTAPVHERMHVLMETLDPFADRDRYARFLVAQLMFQIEVDGRASVDSVRQIVPDLDARGRYAQTLADLNDLQDAMQPDTRAHMHAVMNARESGHVDAEGGVARKGNTPDQMAADRQTLAGLGWLYVSEGSTLGAAFLFKTAQAQLGLSESFGARSLAAAPAGRMTAWRGFTQAIDAADLDPAQQNSVVAGAHDAFDCFRQQLLRVFESAETPAR